MLRNLALMAANQLRSDEYRARADECRETADRFPDDLMGREFAELARQWQLVAEQGRPSRLAA